MRYLEDIVVGEESQHGAYKVTADEIIAFARKYDPHPVHVDQTAADESVFGGLTASSFHTVAMQGALMHAAPQGDTAVIAGLGWDEVRFLNPVRAGDTLSIHYKCLEVRPSTSKLDRGVVRSSVVLRNQHGEDVLTSVHWLLVKRRPKSP